MGGSASCASVLDAEKKNTIKQKGKRIIKDISEVAIILEYPDKLFGSAQECAGHDYFTRVFVGVRKNGMKRATATDNAPFSDCL
jgi:hypothetical protein